MRPGQFGESGGTAELQARLRHVYWIGGGSGAGKSTIARRLADRHGLRTYATDDAMSDHDGRYRPHDAPLLSRFKGMDMDERWVNRSPESPGDVLVTEARELRVASAAAIRRSRACHDRIHAAARQSQPNSCDRAGHVPDATALTHITTSDFIMQPVPENEANSAVY